MLCQLSLFSSPGLFAIHADSTHGCGLSPVLEHTATRSWHGIVISQPGWTQCELAVKPHVLSWFVTDSSEMLSHLPRPGWDHWGSAGKEGWDYLPGVQSDVHTGRGGLNILNRFNMNFVIPMDTCYSYSSLFSSGAFLGWAVLSTGARGSQAFPSWFPGVPGEQGVPHFLIHAVEWGAEGGHTP